MTPITIARPTIVRTRLAPPPVLARRGRARGRVQVQRGVFRRRRRRGGPRGGHGGAGQGERAMRPNAAAAVAAARESGISLVIEGRLRGRVVPGYRLARPGLEQTRGAAVDQIRRSTCTPHSPSPVTTRLPLAKHRPLANSSTGRERVLVELHDGAGGELESARRGAYACARAPPTRGRRCCAGPGDPLAGARPARGLAPGRARPGRAWRRSRRAAAARPRPAP